MYEILADQSRNFWTWWRHQMETFFALLAIFAGNSPVPGEFPAQKPVTRSFDVFLDLRLNERLSKQSWDWWSKTPSRSLWCHVNEHHMQEGPFNCNFITVKWHPIWLILTCYDKIKLSVLNGQFLSFLYKFRNLFLLLDIILIDFHEIISFFILRYGRCNSLSIAVNERWLGAVLIDPSELIVEHSWTKLQDVYEYLSKDIFLNHFLREVYSIWSTPVLVYFS